MPQHLLLRPIRRAHAEWRRFRAAEKEWRKHLRQRLQNPSGKSRPIFLVGCGRSGTSMLVYHLARSWQVELYNEDHPAAFERWRLRDLPVLDSLLERSYAPFVLFKPILDTHRTLLLLARFPDAKVLFTFRHYTDVIHSSLKRFGTENRINHVRGWMNEDFAEFATAPPPQETRAFIRSLWNPALSPESGAALYWLFYNRLYFDLGLKGDARVKLVRYESVVANPKPEFQDLCRFLGIPFESQMVEGIFASSVKQAEPPNLDPAVRQACDALWQQLCREIEAARPAPA